MVYDFLGREYIVAAATCWVVEERYRNYSMLLIKAYFKQQNIDVFFSSTANLISSIMFKAFQGNNINFKEYNENLLFIFFGIISAIFGLLGLLLAIKLSAEIPDEIITTVRDLLDPSSVIMVLSLLLPISHVVAQAVRLSLLSVRKVDR